MEGGSNPFLKKLGQRLVCSVGRLKTARRRPNRVGGGGGNVPLPPPGTRGKLSVLEELTGGGRVICLFLFSKNRQMTRDLLMDHGSSVYGSGVPKPEEEEEKGASQSSKSSTKGQLELIKKA